MSKSIFDLFNDPKIVKRIQEKLPEFFYIAELETQRAGRTGMEVGSVREKILVSLLIYYFGRENVDTEIPITKAEIDVRLFGVPISIKTKKGRSLSGIKTNWTVDQKNAQEYLDRYEPICDIMFAQIIWDDLGFLYYFPLESQKSVLEYFGKEAYIKLPTVGTNPRGIEIKSDAMKKLLEHEKTMKIEIHWTKKETKVDTFERWVELWEKD